MSSCSLAKASWLKHSITLRYYIVTLYSGPLYSRCSVCELFSKPHHKQVRWAFSAVACSVPRSLPQLTAFTANWLSRSCSFWPMSFQKLDLIVQQTGDLQEANTGLKAGAALTLSRTESNDLVQVMHNGTALGSVPKEQGHLIPISLPSCTVRSVRKQDGKVTQIVVRAVLVPTSADTCQHPGIESFCLT